MLLAVGAEAPHFQVKSHIGEEVRLSDYRGKTVILWFYPRANTPGCTREGCGFRDLSADFNAKGVEILGVSFDTVAKNRAFAEKFNFTYPLLCDTDRQIALAYGACETVNDKSAKRIAYLISPQGIILQAYGKVNATTFPAEIMAKL